MSRRPLSSSSTYNVQHAAAPPTYKIKRRSPPVPTQEDLLPPPPRPKAKAPGASRITYLPHPSDSSDEENTPPTSTSRTIPFSSRPRTISLFSLSSSNGSSSPLRDAGNRQALIARAISRRKAVVNEVAQAFSTSSESNSSISSSASSSSSAIHEEAGGFRNIHGMAHQQDYHTFHASASQDPHVNITPSASSPCSSSRIGLGFLSSYDDQPIPSPSPSQFTPYQTHDIVSSSSSGAFSVVPALIRTLTSSWPSSPPLEEGSGSVFTHPYSYFTHMKKHTQEARRLQAERMVEQYRLVIAGMLLNRIKRRPMTPRVVGDEMMKRAYVRSPLSMEVVCAA